MRLHQRLRREHGRHTDDWLITYADTITLLLCLFVIILSIRTSEKTGSQNALALAAQPPAAPDIFARQSPVPPVTHAMDSVADDTRADTGGDAVISVAAEALRDQTTVDDVAEPVTTRWSRVDLAAVAATPPTPNVVSIPSQAVTTLVKSLGADAIEQQGERITTLQINSAAFFSSGNATITGVGKSILRDVAVTLKSSAFDAYHISIEGHTDDMPIATGQFQSNWELSTARAAAVVRFFLEQGIPPRKVTAAGYADTFPIAPNRNADGTVIPENQARNRRVVIKLEKVDKPER
jgi:chemotaxis protein MotB